LLEHPRFRAGYDFLVLRAHAGEAAQDLADWWGRFQEADAATRESMLRPEEAPKKRRRSRGRGRKREETSAAAPVRAATSDAPEPKSS
jgi:poly(A) polymerase